MKKFLLFVLFVALFVAGLYWWKEMRPSVPRPENFTPAESVNIKGGIPRGLMARDEELTNLVESVVPSVVSITTSRRVQLPTMVNPLAQLFGQQFPGSPPREGIQNSLGSGVIVSKEGHILTNNHVIADMDEIKVQLNDGRVFPAKIIGTDDRSDIAVLKIDAPELRPLPLGNSDKVKVGQLVFAIGNPFGLDESVSMGIISAKGRRATDDSTREFFQTDTAINPGNSGGPLVNVRGEIIGINSSIYSGSGGWQGIGFAIPSNSAARVLQSLLKNGRVIRGYLGVAIQQLTPELARQFGRKEETGALVTQVTPGSPAELGGIQTGDIIIKFNGLEVKDIQELRNRVADSAVGSTVQVVVARGNRELPLSVEIVEQPARTGAPRASSGALPSTQQGTPVQNGLAGLQVAPIPADQRPLLPENIHGVIVVAVDPASPLAQALQAGDVIEEINRQPVTSVEEFKR
ncbi:MAG: Do family serine endopeptidase, partial [Verrucomicrobiota bacterium]